MPPAPMLPQPDTGRESQHSPKYPSHQGVGGGVFKEAPQLVLGVGVGGKGLGRPL